MIQIQNLTKRFGKKVLYENLTLTLPETGIVSLAGESGSGKTTLLRLIAGLDKKYHGKIDLGSLSKPAYVFQEPRLLPSSDALENVALPLGNTEEAKEKAAGWLTALGLGDDLHTYPAEMSGGMKQRVSIARAFAYDGDYMILDEPFNGIDAERTMAIMDMVKEYAKGKLVLLVTHNQKQIEHLGADVIPIK